MHVDLASSLAARRTVELLRERGAACEIRTYREHRFARATRFLIVVGGDARSLQALHEAGVLGTSLAPLERVPRASSRAAAAARAYLRGAFIALRLALGAAQPGAPRVARLERRRGDRVARACGGRGLPARRARDGALLDRLAKSRETIRGLLAAMGAHGAELRLEEEGVFAWAREEANRLANADAGNLRRQAQASSAPHRRDRGGRRPGRALARSA